MTSPEVGFPDGGAGKVEDKAKWGGQMLNVANKIPGLRSKCYCCDSRWHPLPKCPLKSTPTSHSAASCPSSREVIRPPDSSVSVRSPSHVQERGSSPRWDLWGNCEQSFSASLELGGRSSVMDAASVVAPDTGAAAYSVRHKWMGRAVTYPACTRFEFGDGRPDEVRSCAVIPVGVVGGGG